jgi:hypothetical protein
MAMARVVRGSIEIRVAHIPRPFPKSVHAVTVWPFIFYEPRVWDDPCVQIHERYHWKDQIRWPLVPWFVAYLVMRPFNDGRKGHPLEHEAYRLQDECESGTDG